MALIQPTAQRLGEEDPVSNCVKSLGSQESILCIILVHMARERTRDSLGGAQRTQIEPLQPEVRRGGTSRRLMNECPKKKAATYKTELLSSH